MSGLRFRAVALTSFSQDHLDFHADMDEYLAAKLRLAAEHLEEGGVAAAPIDDQLTPSQRAGRRRWAQWIKRVYA